MKDEIFMPYKKGGFLVFGIEKLGRRRFLTAACLCGKTHKYRSDSSIFRRKNCGKCFNEYITCNDVCTIYVYDSFGVAHDLKISIHRLNHVKSFVKSKVWASASSSGRTMYAFCGSKINKSELFHRSLFDLDSYHVIDHIDGDGLNCVDDNCRIVDKSENNRNLPMMKTNTSGVTGVSLCKECGFRSYIWHDSRQLSLGTHDDKFEAICARKSAEHRFGYHENSGRSKNSNEPKNDSHH